MNRDNSLDPEKKGFVISDDQAQAQTTTDQARSNHGPALRQPRTCFQEFMAKLQGKHILGVQAYD
jgi:hypothetical protein